MDEPQDVGALAPTTNYGLGRRWCEDARDERHPMRAAMPRRVALRTRHWRCWLPMDQGPTSQCVAYSWLQFIASAPLMTKLTNVALASGAASIDALCAMLYAAAQRVDEWPGENYDGTSVRAGAKILESWDRLAEYVWAWDAATVRDFVISRGPVVVGTEWMSEMFAPERWKGYLRPEGSAEGGHAWLIIGWSQPRQAFRMLNSWGPGWGENGRAWIKFDDLDTLLKRDGEACSGVEKKVT